MISGLPTPQTGVTGVQGIGWTAKTETEKINDRVESFKKELIALFEKHNITLVPDLQVIDVAEKSFKPVINILVG